jgi:hypothetical protein
MDNPYRSLLLLEGTFGICRLDKNASVPEWAFRSEFFSVARTPDELSIVGLQACIPEGVDCDLGWKCLKVESPFEFDLSGMVSTIAALIAERKIDMFIVATQDSDYIMVREHDFAQAVGAISQAGYSVRS